ncbi:MAG: twitching motility protein PilT [Clostridia bacterium]|nr:twitching motility protein PilT [Clostridia bacterium]
MIRVILGDKGSGKTKRLIDITNEALKSEHGNIIFIDDDKRYMYDLRHEIRFVDASEYPVAYKCRASEFLAFLCGMLSADFDLSMICVDAFKKLVRTPLDDPEMEAFFEKLAYMSEAHHCSFILSISASADEVPEYVIRYAE